MKIAKEMVEHIAVEFGGRREAMEFADTYEQVLPGCNLLEREGVQILTDSCRRKVRNRLDFMRDDAPFTFIFRAFPVERLHGIGLSKRIHKFALECSLKGLDSSKVADIN